MKEQEAGRGAALTGLAWGERGHLLLERGIAGYRDCGDRIALIKLCSIKLDWIFIRLRMTLAQRHFTW